MSDIITTELNTNESPPTPAPVRESWRAAGGFEQQTALIRQLIWLYLILWLVEGGLRRWFLPGMATPLLLIRDPVVILIYALAVFKNVFPANGFVMVGLALALLTFGSTLAIGHGNLVVALYGIRCDFLHVPLIFIIGRVLRREDLLRLCQVGVWLIAPYTLLLVAQFYSPQDAWVNRGLGGSLEGAGFAGALDRFRPPGTFSFITGPATLYPVLTACWFFLILARKLPTWLMLVSGVAILIAMPVSISRGLFLAVLIVAVVGVIALFVGGRLSGSMLFRIVFAALLIPLLAGKFGVFTDGMEAFESRWDSSNEAAGGVKVAIVDRFLSGFFGSFSNVPVLGLGTGFSTNVGQKLLSGETGFGASEGEWGRLMYDNGLFLGIALIVYRILLAGTILLASLRAWHRRSPESLIFLSAAFLLIVQGQWGQATQQGAAVIAGGLALAAAGGGGANLKSKKRKAESGNMRRAASDERRDGEQRSESNEAPFAVSAQPKITDSKSEVSGQ